jgi:hypothetical protein
MFLLLALRVDVSNEEFGGLKLTPLRVSGPIPELF